MSAGERVVDIAFELRGEFIGRDYPAALWRALARRLQWLAGDATVAVHPVKGVSGAGEQLVLGRRARLVLRVAQSRVADCAALVGATLDIGGQVEVGSAIERDLQPYPVLYSPLVAMGEEAEGAFLRAVQDALRTLGVRADLVVGRRREVADTNGSTHVGYGLMLHGLSAVDSGLVQNTGLGEARHLGCGVFVPHKSIAPVGDA